MPTIAEQAAAQAQGAAAHLPPEILAVFGTELARIDAAGAPDGVAKVGTALPDGKLLDTSGSLTSLEAARDGRPSVVVLYRGDWCPYCNMTLHTYQQDLVPALEARGVGLIAISPQKPDGSLTMQQKHDLTFTVLSDPGNQIATALGVLTGQPDSVRAAQAQLGANVAATNADGTDALPMPTVVVADAGGTIRFIDVHPNYTTRTEVADILAAVAAL